MLSPSAILNGSKNNGAAPASVITSLGSIVPRTVITNSPLILSTKTAKGGAEPGASLVQLAKSNSGQLSSLALLTLATARRKAYSFKENSQSFSVGPCAGQQP